MNIEKYFKNIPSRIQPLFQNIQYIWEPLNNLSDFIEKNIQPGNLGKVIGDVLIEDNVEIGEGTILEHGAVIKGPTIIGKNCEIRKGAYIRGNVVISDNCVIGNACEFKNCIVMDRAKIPHYNHVCDSIIGNRVQLGGGTIIANLRFDEKNIIVDRVNTGLRKFGVILGDNCRTGCNIALGPGVIFEKDTRFAGFHLLKSGYYNQEKIKTILINAR